MQGQITAPDDDIGVVGGNAEKETEESADEEGPQVYGLVTG